MLAKLILKAAVCGSLKADNGRLHAQNIPVFALISKDAILNKYSTNITIYMQLCILC